MTTNRNKRVEFITKELNEVCKSIDSKICNLTYYENIKHDEFVRIWYKTCSGYWYKDVCITADSIGCIAIEVIQKIIY